MAHDQRYRSLRSVRPGQLVDDQPVGRLSAGRAAGHPDHAHRVVLAGTQLDDGRAGHDLVRRLQPLRSIALAPAKDTDLSRDRLDIGVAQGDRRRVSRRRKVQQHGGHLQGRRIRRSREQAQEGHADCRASHATFLPLSTKRERSAPCKQRRRASPLHLSRSSAG